MRQVLVNAVPGLKTVLSGTFTSRALATLFVQFSLIAVGIGNGVLVGGMGWGVGVGGNGGSVAVGGMVVGVGVRTTSPLQPVNASVTIKPHPIHFFTLSMRHSSNKNADRGGLTIPKRTNPCTQLSMLLPLSRQRQ